VAGDQLSNFSFSGSASLCAGIIVSITIIIIIAAIIIIIISAACRQILANESHRHRNCSKHRVGTCLLSFLPDSRKMLL
jgi:hypothetical protein